VKPLSDLWDAIEGKKTVRTFWTVFYQTETGKTKIVEIEADNLETAFAKAKIHYPNSLRTLISI
jgi:hypothetical protein